MKFILLTTVFISSFILTFVIRYFAIKSKIIDIPNERSSHITPIPRGGGLSIVLTWYLAITYLFFNHEIENSLYFALLSGIFLVIVSFIDDIFNISPKIRLLFQFLSAGLALYFLGGFQQITMPFSNIAFSLFFVFFVWFSIVWFVNLFNFLDGIDGYAATQAIFLSLSLAFFSIDFTPLILAVSTMGFLIWNWQKAKIFMGDVGSTSLGFTLAVLAIHYGKNLEMNILIPIILSSVFWFDATITLIRRKINKENITQAHRKHAFQRITQAGWSHQKTVIYAQFINLLFFILTLIFNYYKISLLFLLIFAVLIILFIYLQIEKKQKFLKN